MTETPTTPDESDDPGTPLEDELSTAADTSGTDDDHLETELSPTPKRSREESYRKRARAAETELVLAQARVSEMNRAEAERQALQLGMADASDLWLNNIDLADVLGDDKLVDAAKVDAAVTDLLARKPHLSKRGPVTPPASNVSGDGKPPGTDTAPTWQDAFTPGTG